MYLQCAVNPKHHFLNSTHYYCKGIDGALINCIPTHCADDNNQWQKSRFIVPSSLGCLCLLDFVAKWLIRNTDSSLRNFTEKLLPLGLYYNAISSFVEQRSHLHFGLVNHALCAAIRDMLKVGDLTQMLLILCLSYGAWITTPSSRNSSISSIILHGSHLQSCGIISIRQFTPCPLYITLSSRYGQPQTTRPNGHRSKFVFRF